MALQSSLPRFLVRPNGVVKHIFQVPDAFVRDILEVCQSSSENYSSGPRSSFFGTVTGNGCIQIWRVGGYCRLVLTVSTGLENCSWADLAHVSGTPHIFVYSRRSGLHMKALLKVLEEESRFATVQIPKGPHAGFCLPVNSVCGGVTVFKLMNSEDDLVSVGFSNDGLPQCDVFKLGGITNLTFFATFETAPLVTLVGSESGKISLIHAGKIREEIDLVKSELVEGTKKKCRVPSDENIAIPLCCAGDEISGYFLIGTRANVLVLIMVRIDKKLKEDLPQLNIIKCERMPNPGVNSIILHPEKKKLLVLGWDSIIRIFSFPEMEYLESLEWRSYPLISTMSFVEVKFDPPSHLLSLASNAGVLSLWNFNLPVQIITPRATF